MWENHRRRGLNLPVRKEWSIYIGGIFLISIADSILSGNFRSCAIFLPPVEKHLNLLPLLNESFIRRVGIMRGSSISRVKWRKESEREKERKKKREKEEKTLHFDCNVRLKQHLKSWLN